jgi:putative transposase
MSIAPTRGRARYALGNSDGARPAAYREGFAGGLTREVIDTLRDATQRGWVPGRDSFRRQIEAALSRSVDPPVRGRPRKPREEDAALLPKQADLL